MQKTISIRRHLLLLGTTLAIATPPAAYTAAAYAATATADSDNGGIEEIMVTARKRVESLRDVPVAVSAFSGLALEEARVTNINHLMGTVPSLFTTQNQTFGPMPNQTYLVMRGVGATSANDPAVATFVDGVYQTSLSFDMNFLDLERLEILRGPQGALFGRNTQGGAVNIITRKPDNEFTGKVMAELADFNSWKLGGMVSGPLKTDKVFASVSGSYASTDGYLKNTTLNTNADDTQKASGRIALRFTPSDALEVILRVDASRNRYGYLGFGVPDDGSHQYVVLDGDAKRSKDNSYGGSLTVNYKFDAATLTSITGANRITSDYWYDFDSGPDLGNYQDQITRQRLLSQELRLASNGGGKLDWLGGLYYFDEVHDQARDFKPVSCSACIFPPVFDPTNVVKEQTRFNRHGWSAFGQATYHPMAGLDLTAGGRYSWEKITAHQAGIIYVPGVGSNEDFDGTNDTTFKNFSPMGSIAYHVTPDVMTYVTVSRGFKAGGYDKYPGTASAVGIPFQPEKSTNYEVGAKTAFFDHRLTLDASAFIVDITNMQLSSTVISPISGLPVGVTTNVGKARSKGFELEVAASPVKGLLLKGNTAYVNSRFTELTSPVGVNVVGGRVPYVPRWTASGSAQYTHGIGVDDLQMKWGLDYRYVGSYQTGNGVAPFDPRLDIAGYDRLDAHVTLQSSKWDITVFCDNITDNFSITRRFAPAFQTYTRAEVLSPRQFGGRLTYHW